MAEDNDHNQAIERPEEEDAIGLLDLLLVLARHKKKILIIPFLIGCATAVYSLQVPEIFASKTTLLPPQQQKQSSAMAMLNQMGPMAGLAGDALGLQSSGELYVSILKSRRIGDRIINEFDLLTVYEGAKTTNDVRKMLAEATTVSLGRKDGMITVSVEDQDPQRAADLANAYAVELEKLTHEFALGDASRRRIFLEKQLAEVKETLQLAEIAYKDFQKKSGMIQSGQGSAIIGAIATLRAQISSKEVELGSLRLSATEENPEVQLLLTGLAELKKQLKKLEQDNPEDRIGSLFQGTSRLPEVGLEFSRLMRKLKYAESLYGMLNQQYELAKADESEDAPLVQVLDVAIPPEKRIRPKRTQMVLLSMVASGFAMCLLAFMLEAKRQAEDDPEQSEKMADLKQNLWRI